MATGGSGGSTWYPGGRFLPGGGRAPTGGTWWTPHLGQTGEARYRRGGTFTPGGRRLKVSALGLDVWFATLEGFYYPRGKRSGKAVFYTASVRRIGGNYSRADLRRLLRAEVVRELGPGAKLYYGGKGREAVPSYSSEFVLAEYQEEPELDLGELLEGEPELPAEDYYEDDYEDLELSSYAEGQEL